MTCDQRPVLLLHLPDGFRQLQRLVAAAGHWPI
jgi:hypothetical protein